MPTKIRLQRHGKKGYAFFHIVIADGRAPRDGKFIEKIGTYNPNTNPATIELDFNRALSWVSKGAQPTDTTRAILSYKGVMYKHHLETGVRKGAFTQEEAEKKFEKWLQEKTSKISGKVDSLSKSAQEARAKQLTAEQEVSRKRAEAIEAKNKAAEAAAADAEAPAAAEEVAPPAEEAPAQEENTTPAAE